MSEESAGATANFPRLVVAGLSGESGKTLVSLALLLLAGRKGIPAGAFKKGPDYIDAAWLAWAARSSVRNLDSYLMGFPGAVASFAASASSNGLNVVEGNRGLYDGADASGTHSTAELAKALDAPVVLVLNATKVTRTAAALVLGCQHLDSKVRLAGVILNQVAGGRHESIVREAIESVCHIPILGAIPRARDGVFLPSRHLGLITPQEYGGGELLAEHLLQLVGNRLDFGRLLEIARQASPMVPPPAAAPVAPDGLGLTIGYLHDSAFSFYYPENLDALRATGAELLAISPLTAAVLPPILDALYIGGGFPETHAGTLSENAGFLASVRNAARNGLPIYAECGGLMYLSRALTWQGRRFPMVSALSFEVEVCERPQGHGYVDLLVDRPNAFFDVGTQLRGHEFHYSQILPAGEPLTTACSVLRGSGCGNRRDAVLTQNIWAAYTHLHAIATPDWALAIVKAARAAVMA